MIEYDKEVIKILKLSEKEALNLGSAYISTEHIILATLKHQNSLSYAFNKLKITYNNYLSIIKKNCSKSGKKILISYTPLLKKIIINSSKNNIITLKNIILGILEEENSVAIAYLNMINCNTNELYEIIKSNMDINIGINLNKKVNNEKIWIRESELNDLIESLCKKNKNNVILIGEAGVGKTTLVETLAKRINEGSIPNQLLNKEIISINISSIVSGTKYRGEFEEKFENIIKNFINNDKYILFIDEIHTIVGAGASEGSIDAANILKPYLARNDIKCIGATTVNEYEKYIKFDKALSRRFQIIHIKEPNRVETRQILMNAKKYYEDFHNITIDNKQIDKIINLSDKYFPNKKEPDRSLDILDIVCTKSKLKINTQKYELLNNEKNSLLKSKKYKEAMRLNKKIVSLQNKSKKVCNKTIFECFNFNETNKIGFKIS